MPLQYPLLFPYVTGGWSYSNIPGLSGDCENVITREFIAFLIQYKPDEGNIFYFGLVDCSYNLLLIAMLLLRLGG